MAVEVDSAIVTYPGLGPINVSFPALTTPPRLIFVLSHLRNNPSGYSLDTSQLFGIWTPTGQGSQCLAAGFAQPTLQTGKICTFGTMQHVDFNNLVQAEFSITNPVIGGCSVSYAAPPPVGTYITLLAFGGDVEAELLPLNMTAGFGNETYSGFSFEPESVVLVSTGEAAFNTPGDIGTLGIGFWSQNGGQIALATNAVEGSQPVSALGVLSDTSIYFTGLSAGQFVATTPNGFTLNRNSPLPNQAFFGVAIRGAEFRTGTIESPLAFAGGVVNGVVPNPGQYPKGMIGINYAANFAGLNFPGNNLSQTINLMDLTQGAPTNIDSGSGAAIGVAAQPGPTNITSIHTDFVNWLAINPANSESAGAEFFALPLTDRLDVSWFPTSAVEVYRFGYLMLGDPVPPPPPVTGLSSNENTFVARITGTVAYTNNDSEQFSAHIDERGIVSVNSTSMGEQAVYEVNSAENWIAETLALLSPTLALTPNTGTPTRAVKDLVLEVSGRVARPDNTQEDFIVQYVDGQVIVPNSSGPLTVYEEAASLSVVRWLEGAVGPGNVTY